MRAQVTDHDHLQALPICVVLRTARGMVIERDENGWSQMGNEHSWVFDKKKDFPATVLWTYADEITPPDIDPDQAVELVRQLRAAQAAAQAQQQQEAQRAQANPEVHSTGNNGGVDEGKQNTQTEAQQMRNGSDPLAGGIEGEIILPERRGPLG